VFSFLCDPSWVNAGVSLAGTRLRTLLHPPMLSRITILCKMLAYYGFEKVDSKCAEMLSQYLGKLRFLDGERRFIEIYEGFINANMPLLREVADFINSSIPECCCGRIRRGQVTEDQWLAEKEDVLQKALNGSFYEVKATPEEVLNTIWYKKIFHPELSHIPAHTAWRIILANHREPTTGGFDGQEDRRGSLCEV